MAKGSWKQIYPKDCYSQMLILAGETGTSFPKVVNILVREGLISMGKIPKDTSLTYVLLKQPAPEPKEELVKIKRTFIQVEERFEKLKPEVQQIWIKKAQEHPELEEAKAILRKLEKT
jgi:hypothetical protein